MSRVLGFLAALLVGLALTTVVGYVLMTRITRQWFARDLTLRASLAVSSAQQGLGGDWGQNKVLVGETLNHITRDERILGAAACDRTGQSVAVTAAYPLAFACEELMKRMNVASAGMRALWSMSADLPSGAVHLSAVRVGSAAAPSGVIALVHDLSYVARRERTTRWLSLCGFFVLSAGASALTFVAAKLAWKTWLNELRSSLSGGSEKAFHPLLKDIRLLAQQLASEHEREARGGKWSPERLRATLLQYLQGERVVILANREPYVHQKNSDGIRVMHPASGLVSALEPVMRACGGVWVGHGSGSADKDTVDKHDRVRVPPGEESYSLRRVWLSEAEENGYYYGFSNEGLWPLCHVAHARPVFRSEDYELYKSVNQRFADAVCDEVDRDDPIILVQDYHFALAPKMIRERLPRATIITFWHTPWPNAERFGICPWREELIAGLLGSSVVGFHTQQHCNNFIDSVDAFVESRIDRETHAVVQGARRTLIRPYPISIEWPVRWLETVPAVGEAQKLVRRELGLPEDALLGIGIDRLDYTKGIEERLQAVDALLTRFPQFRGKFFFAQLAAPSRTKIARYQELNDRVEAVAKEINERWGTSTYQPIILLRAHHEPVTVFRFYRAANLCYVSSLHDGMNLVAKEFVAARDDEQGVLLLSQFTGAARDLSEALIVNPYDFKQTSDALAAALRMSPEEQRERMQSMRRYVSEFNVYRWAGRMLVDAAELRRKDRLMGRLSSGDAALRSQVA